MGMKETNHGHSLPETKGDNPIVPIMVLVSVSRLFDFPQRPSASVWLGCTTVPARITVGFWILA